MNAGRLTLKIAIRQPSVPGDVKNAVSKKILFYLAGNSLDTRETKNRRSKRTL